jgi:prepilin-type processing-associated H-X9-DG protein
MECPACGQSVEESAATCSACGTDTRLLVRAADGSTYGPYRMADLRQYAAQGRIPVGAMLESEDGSRLTLAEADVVPPPPVVAAPAPARSGTPRWLIALIVAIVAAVLLPMALILAAILFPVFARAREKARQAECLSTVRTLSLACLQYAQANNDTLPDAATWRQDIQSHLPGTFTWECPSSHRGQQSYELNPDLSRMSLAAIRDPASTAMIYEADRVAGGGPHGGGSNVGFTDGHVKWVTQSGLSQLRQMGGADSRGP